VKKPTIKPRRFGPPRSKRQSTFEVLYDLAIAMTADRSLKDNLQIVVDRSRKLLGTDTSYIAICHEASRSVHMHNVSGIRTEAFKKIRLPFGKGLGGLVAKTRRGFIIDDYLDDERITRAVDDVVAAEGIVSGMATPIHMGDRNLGVLYVFNRRRTAFSQSDLDTLFLIANLAAVEISRKRVEETLRESEEKYRSVMEASGEPLIVYDNEGRVVFFNPAFTRVFGWTLDELIGKKTDYTPQENWPETRTALSKLFRSGKGYTTFESRRLTKSGAFLDVIISASVYRDRNGSPLGMIANLRDITARKRAEEELRKAHGELEIRVVERTAELSQSNERLKKEIGERKRIEQALRESERLYRTLLDFVPYPIVVFTLDGNVSYLNPTFTDIFGWTLDELRGKRIPYVPSGLEEEATDLLNRLLAERVLQHYESRRLTKDGRILDVSLRATLFSESGEVPSGEIVILRDITEQKRIARNNEAMLRISLALPAHPDLEGLLDYVTGEVKDLLAVEGAAILLLDEQTQELSVAGAAYDDAATQRRVKETRFHLSETVASDVIEAGKPVVLNDSSEAEYLHRERDEKLGYHTRSLLEVPLRGAGRIIGVLCAVNKKEGAFDQKDIDLLTMTEGTVALSIENARAARDLRIAYKEVTSLNRAKDKAFHHLSHELKTPTSVLLTSLQILAKRLASIAEQSWKPTLERAKRNLNRILEIQYEAEDIILDKQHKTYYLLSLLLDQCTDELEALIADQVGEGSVVESIRARVEEIFGPRELVAERIRLNEFTLQRLEILRPSFAHRQVHVATCFEDTPLLMIPADPLQKVIDGLLKNAIENTPDEGKIEVTVRKKRTGAELVIRDYGIGITADTKMRVFEGFFTAQDSAAYSSKLPFDFQAGGKGADLLRIKVFSERYNFTIRMESSRCGSIPDDSDACPGTISDCPSCTDARDCHLSGGTTVFVYFPPASGTLSGSKISP
jgi:PAS domain S-box-containing protein